MGGISWIVENWFVALNALGIIASLTFTGITLHSESKTRRVANLLAITSNHRELWTELFRRPELRRVLDPAPDLECRPITVEEQLFVILLAIHVSSVYEALKEDLLISQEGLRRDIWWIFSRPIPQIVWREIKVMHNDAFVDFLENCLNWK